MLDQIGVSHMVSARPFIMPIICNISFTVVLKQTADNLSVAFPQVVDLLATIADSCVYRPAIGAANRYTLRLRLSSVAN
jgi:hypothetical protein